MFDYITDSFINHTVDSITIIILFFTALILVYYTYETYLLRKEANYQTHLGVRPLVKMFRNKRIEDDPTEIYIQNIGKGPALNIEIRISELQKNSYHEDMYVLNEANDHNNSPIFNLGVLDIEKSYNADWIKFFKEYIKNLRLKKDRPIFFIIWIKYESILDDGFYITKHVARVIQHSAFVFDKTLSEFIPNK